VIRARAHADVECPLEQAFDFLADLRNEPEFNADAFAVVKVTPGEIGLDTAYTERVKRMGRFDVRIHRYDRPHELGFDATGDRADVRVVFRFSPIAGGRTAIDADVEFQPKGATRALTPVLRLVLPRMFQRQRPAGIKRALEAYAKRG
jgi:hypothetical protein